MKLLSPAKVNLYLHVRRKRPDGFHELDTLFERVGLFDEISFKRARSGIRVLCAAAGVPSGRRNIAYRAAQLLRDRYKVRSGVVLRIKKRIPAAAGLGGGSGNAATVLAGLNRFWRLGLGRKALLELAGELGSDVPFFLLDTPFAQAGGRGERLKPIRTRRQKIWHCIVKPPFGISTRQAYGDLRPSSLTPQKGDAKLLLHSIRKGDRNRLSCLLRNSLEASLNKRVRSINKIKSELVHQGATAALMSGSGSAVFGIFPSEEAAKGAAYFFKKKKGWKAFAVSTV